MQLVQVFELHLQLTYWLFWESDTIQSLQGQELRLLSLTQKAII